MITYKTGDLMQFTEDAFGHGCNCQKTMGSGVALAVRKKFPELYRDDQNDKRTPQERLGHSGWAQLSNGKFGYNLYTQLHYLPRGKCHLDYNALKSALEDVCNDMIDCNLKTLALPRIGAGLAGGDWNKILPIIEHASKVSGIDITIYSLE